MAPGHARTTDPVSIPEQRLDLLEGGAVAASYPVSTARNGPASSAAAVAPRVAGIASASKSARVAAQRRLDGSATDWVKFMAGTGGPLPGTGLDSDPDSVADRAGTGFNRGGNCDTYAGSSIIHGCPDTAPMGVTALAWLYSDAQPRLAGACSIG
jgi:L,D-transpeptidase YbiS